MKAWAVNYNCGQCGARSYWPRCATCRKPTSADRRRRKQFIEDWIEQHGLMCAGFEREPHPASRLEADHIIPLALGGAESGRLQALCHACNGRKNNRVRFGPRRGRGGMNRIANRTMSADTPVPRGARRTEKSPTWLSPSGNSAQGVGLAGDDRGAPNLA